MELREQILPVVDQWLADQADAQEATLTITVREGRRASILTSERLDLERDDEEVGG